MTQQDRHWGDRAWPCPGGAANLAVPLDVGEIGSLLDARGRAAFDAVHVLGEVDSTNRWLTDRLASPSIRSCVCVAERQRQGRGRRGRQWRSPAAGNIYMSLGWRFERAPAALSGLGLVAGVVSATAIGDAGIPGITLKWPNDLLAAGAKVGGILVESSSTGGGQTSAVIGIGINITIPKRDRDRIAQPVTDLSSVAGRPVHRASIVANIINGFAGALPVFERDGLQAFRDRWLMLDRTCHSDVMLDDGNGVRAGHALGIDYDGALLVQTDSGLERFHAGDVSLRVTT